MITNDPEYQRARDEFANSPQGFADWRKFAAAMLRLRRRGAAYINLGNFAKTAGQLYPSDGEAGAAVKEWIEERNEI